MQQQYLLHFIYAEDMSDYLCDTHTFCASVLLYTHGIYSVQYNARTIQLESSPAVTFALLLLNGTDEPYTVVAV